jgi:hypothetical protein
VDEYRRETQWILSQFLNNEITLEECTAALNAELANLAPRIRQACPVALRILITVNDEVVMKEVERRKTSQSKQDVWSTI